ncbi:hypothetical protein LTR95_006178 [Oleoguttula sp. CCFEE 5521]
MNEPLASSHSSDDSVASLEQVSVGLGQSVEEKCRPTADSQVTQQGARPTSLALEHDAPIDTRVGDSHANVSELDFFQQVVSRITDARKILSSSGAREAHSSQCSIYSTRGVECEDVRDPVHAMAKIKRMCTVHRDSICIIENISASWINALGGLAEVYMPHEFFVGHASDEDNLGLHRQGLSRRATFLDDLLGQASFLREQRFKKQPDGTQILGPRLRDLLTRAVVAVSSLKAVMDNWGFYGEKGAGGVSMDQWSSLDSVKNRCKNLLQDLEAIGDDHTEAVDDNHSDRVEYMKVCMRSIEADTQMLERSRLRGYHNLNAVYRFTVLEANVPSSTFVRRFISEHGYAMDVGVLLVDSQPGTGALSSVMFKNASTNVRVGIPLLFVDSDPWSTLLVRSSTYEMCKRFARHTWHAEVLCNEEQLPSRRNLQRDNISGDSIKDTRAWAACDPQVLLYLLSSSAWETNLVLLRDRIRRSSFQDIPQATSADTSFATNTALHDCRRALELLKHEVADVDTHMPQDLDRLYDTIPRMRRRGRATYLSPVENHKSILERAKELEKLLIDSFQLLTNSVSVYESHESMKQTRRATWIAVLAFFYLPATLVTGIFGMNIVQTPNGFA